MIIRIIKDNFRDFYIFKIILYNIILCFLNLFICMLFQSHISQITFGLISKYGKEY